jgi:hypothetical protein
VRHEHKEPIHLLTIAAMSTALACLGFGDLIPHWSEILIRLSLFAATTIILAVYVRRWHSVRVSSKSSGHIHSESPHFASNRIN